MTAPATPPHETFQTADYDQAGEYLTGIFGGTIRLAGHKKGAPFRLDRLVARTLSISTATHVGAIECTAESMPVLMLGRPCTAIVDYRSGSAEHRFGPNDVYVSNRAEDQPTVQAGWRNGAVQAATFPFALLDQVAATAQTRRPEPIRFPDLRPHSPAAGHQVAATLDFLVATLRDQPDAAGQSLVVGAAGRLLAATVLSTFPNTAFTEPTIEDRHDAHPATLRRAIGFIDDHAHLDISVADIAAAANVTIRALQYAFRRHCGTTPMGYLRRVRLHHAHRELLAADPTTGVTVTQVAAHWGFFHPGRFAAHYRASYGRRPYQDLAHEIR